MPPVLLRLARTAARTGVAACVTLAAMALPALPAGAIGGLTVTPTTWDIIGLDSNNVTQGPNVFPTGQRVCNTTGAAMTGVSATLVFDSANANINLTSSPTIAIGTLAAGACAFPYFDITITRTSAAYDTARRYHVTVTADGGVTASSPLVRQLYVEHLVSQGRNAVASISGTTIVNPAPIPAAGTVYIGQQYKFTVNMSTATQGYAELFTPVSFPADIFRVNSMAITYSAPSGGTNDQPYADGCAWGQDPTVSTPTYRSCNGGSSSYVNHGGGMTVTYVVTVVAAGSGAVSAMVNDGSGSSFHYNSDFGTSVDAMPFVAMAAPQLSLALSNNSPWTRSGSGAVTATVTNQGVYATTGVQSVGLTLPAGLTYSGSATPGWTCGATGQQVTCTHSAALAAAATGTVVVAVTTGSAATSPQLVTGTADTSGFAQGTASTSPTVVQPLSTPTFTSTGVGTAVQTVTVPTNSGDTVRILDSGGNPATTVVVAGQGSYTMNTSTSISFTPVSGYTGTATPVTYRRTDATSAYGTATYTPTVTPPAAPSPPALTSSGAFGATQTTTLTSPAGGTVRLLDASSSPATTVTNASGTYTLATSSGVVTFVPSAGFYGTATAVAYRSTDSYAQSGDSTYTPTVGAPAPPTAPALTSTGPQDIAQTVNLTIPAGGSVTLLDAANAPASTVAVSEGSYSLDPATGIVTFLPAAGYTGTVTPVGYRVTDAAAQSADGTYTPDVDNTAPPAPAPPALTSSGAYNTVQSQPLDIPSGGSVTLVGSTGPTTSVSDATGSYSLDAVSGVVTFMPSNGYVGPATPVTYRAIDAYGQSGDSTYTATVDPPATSTPPPLTSSGPYNTAQTVTAGIPPAGGVQLLDAANAPASSVSNAAGAYVLTAASGLITFTPVSGFVGTAPPIGYRATDAYGQSADSTYTATVDPPAAPSPAALTSNGPLNTTQSVSLAIPSGGTVRLLTPANISATSVSNASGSYLLDPITGVVTFTPSTDFVGTATAVGYRARDAFGQYGDSTYTPTVATPGAPTPAALTTSGALDTAQTVTLTIPAGGTSTLLDSASAPATTVTNPAGTYVLDTTTGIVTFTPTAGVSGNAPSVGYRVTDAYSQSGDGTYTVTVLPAPPTAGPMSSTGPMNTTQTVTLAIPAGGTVTLLDATSAPATTVSDATGTYVLDSSTGLVTFTPVTGFSGVATVVSYAVRDAYAQTATNGYTANVVAPPAPTDKTSAGTGTTVQSALVTIPPGDTVTLLDGVGAATTTLTIAGQGTYDLDTTTGVITFSPVLPFQGQATAVTYRLTDGYGQTGTATYTPTVNPPGAPTAAPLTSTGVGTAVQSVIATIPTGGSVRLLSGVTPVVSLTVAGVGDYQLDTTTGIVTFAPVFGFAGTPAAVGYRVTDVYGTSASSTYTAVVTPPPGPQPIALLSSGIGATPQSVTVTIPPGGSVTLLDALGQPVTAIVVPGVGTYAIDPATGIISFAPVSGFQGTPAPMSYSVTDAYGTSGTATYTPTVTAEPAPVINGVTTTGPSGATQQAGITLPPGTTITLLDANGAPTDTVVVPGQGTYVLDPVTGVITFTGVSGFVGSATGVVFVVTDVYGSTASGVYGATVTARHVTSGAPTPSVTVRALVVLHAGDTGVVPATCRLSAGTQVRCDVQFLALVNGRYMVIGTGTRTVAAALAGRTVVVSVTLTSLGRALAATTGGVRVVVAAKLWQPAGSFLAARSGTRVVTTGLVLRPVFFATASSTLRASDRAYLDHVRTLLAGVTSVRCDGFTDSRSTSSYNLGLARARAVATCAYLLRGTHIRAIIQSYGEAHPHASNTTVDGRARNRRAEIVLEY